MNFAAEEDVADEALIKAIRKMNDVEEDPARFDSCSDGEGSDSEKVAMPVARIDKDMERMQNDTALRHHLKLGSSFTGPKGVKADYKFHKQQERARDDEKQRLDAKKLSDAALSSGWLQRTIALEEADQDEKEEFLASYRKKRIAELIKISCSDRFGKVIDLDSTTFVRAIDGESPEVKILVHLYDIANPVSRQVNDFFTQLANIYRGTKFCRIPALEADNDFDLIGLPAVLVYKGGSLEMSLIRISDEIPGWYQSNRCSFRDFEEYLIIQNVLDNEYRAEVRVEQEDSESDESSDF